MNAIERRRKYIKTKIGEWNSKLHDLQNVCDHKNAVPIYHRDTGNYDPSMDRYWIDWHCKDCDKRWETPQ